MLSMTELVKTQVAGSLATAAAARAPPSVAVPVARNAAGVEGEGAAGDPKFTGKETYKIGDISKEADARIKAAVADMRNKDEYELGDLTLALDAVAKEVMKTAKIRTSSAI